MKKFNKKALVLLVCVTLLLTISVSGTVAYLADGSGPVVNEFKPVNVPPSVEEKLEGNVKKEVAIKNNGNIDAYIRAMVIATWQDASGNVLGVLPVAGTDYSISFPADSGWVKHSDGFYYYTSPVAAGGTTNILCTDCKPLKVAPAEGYTLHVEILAQSIQADGKNADGKYAVEDAWGVTVDPATKAITN